MSDTTTTPAPGTAAAGASGAAAATGTGGTSGAGTPVPATQASAAPSPGGSTTTVPGTPAAAQAGAAGAAAAGPDGTLLGGADGATNQGKAGGAPEGQQAAKPIEVKFPDGVHVDEAVLGEFKATAAKYGLTQEAAQALVDLQVKANAAEGKQMDDAYTQMRTDWVTAVKADKEIGGAKFDESLKTARRAIAAFGSDAFRQFLNEFGVGDHPELVRFMVKVGAALSEDDIAGATTGTTTGPTAPDEDAIMRARYPSMFPKE